MLCSSTPRGLSTKGAHHRAGRWRTHHTNQYRLRDSYTNLSPDRSLSGICNTLVAAVKWWAACSLIASLLLHGFFPLSSTVSSPIIEDAVCRTKRSWLFIPEGCRCSPFPWLVTTFTYLPRVLRRAIRSVAFCDALSETQCPPATCSCRYMHTNRIPMSRFLFPIGRRRFMVRFCRS